MFESAYVRQFIKDDMYHGVSREFAKKRAKLTEKFMRGDISSQEYHRQMDAVHEQYPGDYQKIMESGKYH